MKTMTTDEMVKKLMSAKKSYYSGKPTMSDAEFDALEDRLRSVNPKDPYFSVVGAAINAKQKFKHKIPMLSCDKVKNIDDVEKWLKKLGQGRQDIIIENKIDGLSADLGYENGKLVSAATRGDGNVGQLITSLMDHIAIPKTISLPGIVNIRGEFVIFTDSDIDNPEETNLRNICAGIINRKTIVPAELKHVHFIGYQILGANFTSESEKVEWLRKNKFETTEYVVVKSIKEIEEYYNRYVSTLKAKFKYATDGLVLVVNDSTLHDKIDSMGSTDHDHLYAKAIKPPNESAETILEDIEWNVSRSGKLIPTAIFKTVVIDGSRISRASLTSYENCVRMQVEKGDKLEVVKAGAIIPYIERNLTKNVSQR